MARLRKQLSFSEFEKDIYDYLENCKNASALVKKLVREHMIVEQLKNQGAIDKSALVVDFRNYNKQNLQTKDLNDNTKLEPSTNNTKIDDYEEQTEKIEEQTKELEKETKRLSEKDKENQDLINKLPF